MSSGRVARLFDSNWGVLLDPNGGDESADRRAPDCSRAGLFLGFVDADSRPSTQELGRLTAQRPAETLPPTSRFALLPVASAFFAGGAVAAARAALAAGRGDGPARGVVSACAAQPAC